MRSECEGNGRGETIFWRPSPGDRLPETYDASVRSMCHWTDVNGGRQLHHLHRLEQQWWCRQQQQQEEEEEEEEEEEGEIQMTTQQEAAGQEMHETKEARRRHRRAPLAPTHPFRPLLPVPSLLLQIVLLILLIPSSFLSAAVQPPLRARLHLPRTHGSGRLGTAAKQIWNLTVGAINEAIQGDMDPSTMQLHGGTLLVGPVLNVYLIYYGTEWKASERRLVEGFIRGLDGQSKGTVKEWWRVTTEWYKDGEGRSISNTVRLHTITNNYSLGKNLTGFGPTQVIVDYMKDGSIPFDTNAIYITLTDPSVTVDGYCTYACGWHANFVYNKTVLPFAFVAHPQDCYGCSLWEMAASGTPAVQALISTIAHEVTETATDPILGGGWYTKGNQENADICAWKFPGTGFSGKRFNMVADGMAYFVQGVWNPNKQRCTVMP